MLDEKQIKARIRVMVERSWNRLYLPEFINREVDENFSLLMIKCKQNDCDPQDAIILINKKMRDMKNFAFCQALSDVFHCQWEIPALCKLNVVNTKINRRKR